jgi:hypothetical protein
VSGDGAYQCTIVIHIDAHFSTRRVGRSPRVFLEMQIRSAAFSKTIVVLVV